MQSNLLCGYKKNGHTPQIDVSLAIVKHKGRLRWQWDFLLRVALASLLTLLLACGTPPAIQGGILQDDWTTPHEHKLDIVAKAHPNPTKWPQDEVTPVAPSPEQCEVEPAVDTTAFSGGGGAAASEGNGPVACDGAAPPPPAPAAAAEPLSSGDIQVRPVDIHCCRPSVCICPPVLSA